MKLGLFILSLLMWQISTPQNLNQQTKGNSSSVGKANYSIDKNYTFTCDELIFYRDNTLAKEFDLAYSKYTLGLEAKKDLENIKASLLNDKASWYQVLSTSTASSDWTLLFAQFNNAWKLLCDKYLFILKTVSGASSVSTAPDYGTTNQEYWYKVLSAGKSIQKAVTGDAEKEAYKAVASKNKETKKLSDAISLALDFSNNLENFEKLEKNHTQLKAEINRVLTIIDERYAAYERSISASRETQNSIDEIVKAIDKYLLEKNCKPIDAIEQTLQKELAKNTAISLTKTDTFQNGNSYFIFLTADISIAPKQSLFSNLQTPKHLHVISKPIWYTQNQTDQRLIKEHFLRAIENQIQNLDKDFYKNYSMNNYEAVGYINTNFKESIPLLNAQQYQQALINYKNLILNIDKTAEFFQLQ